MYRKENGRDSHRSHSKFILIKKNGTGLPLLPYWFVRFPGLQTELIAYSEAEYSVLGIVECLFSGLCETVSVACIEHKV